MVRRRGGARPQGQGPRGESPQPACRQAVRAHRAPDVDERVRAQGAGSSRPDARHRQARHPGRGAGQTRRAGRIGMEPDAHAPGDGPEPARPSRPVESRNTRRALPPRKARRKRLSLRSQSGSHPDRGAHRRGCRHVRRAHLRPAIPQGMHPRGGASSVDRGSRAAPGPESGVGPVRGARRPVRDLRGRAEARPGFLAATGILHHEKVKFGVAIFPTDYAISMTELAPAAEQMGFESLWVAEHSHIPTSRLSPWPGGAELPKHYWHTMDPFVALTVAALATKTIRVGTGICLLVERDPIHTAKEVASVDAVSNGRFIFGIGGGWNREEMEDHGTDFSTRWKLLRERVEAIKAIWTEDVAEYHGDMVDFGPMWEFPKPVQQLHPPIILGGSGPKILERVVR